MTNSLNLKLPAVKNTTDIKTITNIGATIFPVSIIFNNQVNGDITANLLTTLGTFSNPAKFDDNIATPNVSSPKPVVIIVAKDAFLIHLVTTTIIEVEIKLLKNNIKIP